MSITTISEGLALSPWMTSTLKSVGVASVIFLIFWLASRYTARRLANWLGKLFAWNESLSRVSLKSTLERPMRFLFVLLGLYLALRYLPLPIFVEGSLLKIFRSLVIIFVAWILFDLASSESLFSQGMQEKLKLDNIILSFFSRITRFAIIALAIVMVIQEWGYNVNGLIAGLGLGGLALALAAREALANVVAGVVLIIEKPFLIGDWIATPSVEGTVESISFRSTRVRSTSQALTTIPNSILASQAITNHARLGKRKLEFILTLPMGTGKRMIEKYIQYIKEVLRSHSEVEPESCTVVLHQVGKESLDIVVHCLISNVLWEEYMRVREEINLEILGMLESSKEVSPPSQ